MLTASFSKAKLSFIQTQNTEVTSSVHLRLPAGQVTFQGIIRRSKTDKAAKACRAAILSLYRSVSSWKRSDFSPSQQARVLIYLGGKGLLHAPTSCPQGQPADGAGRGTRERDLTGREKQAERERRGKMANRQASNPSLFSSQERKLLDVFLCTNRGGCTNILFLTEWHLSAEAQAPTPEIKHPKWRVFTSVWYTSSDNDVLHSGHLSVI